ncbi:transcriptional activator of glycolytic enzymes-domain-containing protein, partial [Phlyctochytrium arcticum]
LPTRYELSSVVKTVPDAWREYDQGIHGGPAIKRLNEVRGTSWRSVKKVKVAYCRRLVLFNAILQAAKDRDMPEADVAAEFECRRIDAKQTLSVFIASLKNPPPPKQLVDFRHLNIVFLSQFFFYLCSFR